MATTKVDIWNMALRKVGVSNIINTEDDDSVEARVCFDAWDNLILEVFESRPWRFARRQLVLSSLATQSQSHTGDASLTEFAFAFGYRESSQVAVTVDGTTKTITTDYTITQATNGNPPFITFTSAPANSAAIIITVTVSRVGWDYVYSLPSDYVTPIALLGTDTRSQDVSAADRMIFEVMLDDAATGYLLATDIPLTSMAAFEYIGLVTDPRAWPATFTTCVAWRLSVDLAEVLTKDLVRANYCGQQYLVAASRAWAQAQNIGQRQEPLSPSELARGD